MERRKFITGIASTLAISIAGCSTDTNNETKTEISTPTQRDKIETNSRVKLENAENIELAYVNIRDEKTAIEVQMTSQTEKEVAASIGYIIGVYTNIVREDSSAGNATITFIDYYSNDNIGETTIKKEWVIKYLNNEITQEELIMRVIENINVYENV